MRQIEVFSPAKINLFLAVLGKQADGFHELVSLVAPVDFGDSLRISVVEDAKPSVALRCSDASLPTDAGNLAYAAAQLFLDECALAWRVEIDLEKRIPHGAGLGGGSSNASAVLRALAQLAGESAPSEADLLEWAARLGSDCPLFLDAAPQLMRGRGERLQRLSDDARERLEGRRVLLFKPSFSINTAWAYGRLAAAGDAYDAGDWAESRVAAWSEGELALESLLHNAFERVVFDKYAAFEPLFSQLRDVGARCLMSGSGSCCLAFVDTVDGENRCIEAIRAAWGPRAFVRQARIGGSRQG